MGLHLALGQWRVAGGDGLQDAAVVGAQPVHQRGPVVHPSFRLEDGGAEALAHGPGEVCQQRVAARQGDPDVELGVQLVEGGALVGLVHLVQQPLQRLQPPRRDGIAGQRCTAAFQAAAGTGHGCAR